MKGVFIFTIAFLLCSCVSESKKPVYYDVSEETESSEEIVVPFRDENGVKLVPVKVNGVGFEMIFDTGCSGTLISLAEAQYLYSKGTLTEEDFLRVAPSQIADGSVVENMVVNLKEVVIDDRIFCANVQATVSSNANAPLLLGNEVLDRTATITIDNNNNTLIFKLK